MSESSTETIISAMRILARDIQSNDGVANGAIAEAAQRLEEQAKYIESLKERLKDLSDRVDFSCEPDYYSTITDLLK